MGAALSIFAILTISVFIVRVASVALRLTGLAEESARLQSDPPLVPRFSGVERDVSHRKKK